jgi:DNA-binding NtrC family response regulator
MNEPLRILLVDDNEDLLMTLSQIFKRAGFDVDVAADGLKAVEQYFQGDFNVTLMDIDLPGLNGVEAFRLIREKDSGAAVILMTGSSNEELMQMAIDEGVLDILRKPLRVDTMIDVIRRSNKALSVSSFMKV